MRRVIIGMLAHVDAGKTTLSEALLYASGQLRKLGRVDHGDVFLDTDMLERKRGITIFSHPAVMSVAADLQFTLLDTPGHVDFSVETERVLRVLDYAMLVVSAADGIQGHTETLWRMLRKHHIPTFIVINKIDMQGVDVAGVMQQIQQRFGEQCIDCQDLQAAAENIAMQDEQVMEDFLTNTVISSGSLQRLVADEKLVPCFAVSSLKIQGIHELLANLVTMIREPKRGESFGARVYKISHDQQGNRLTWLKVTNGILQAKSLLQGGFVCERDDRFLKAGVLNGCDDQDMSVENSPVLHSTWEEKLDQIRVYSGAQYTTVTNVEAGSIVAVTGLTKTIPGEGLGVEACDIDSISWVMQPVLSYALDPLECDLHQCLSALRTLEDEDPMLRVTWVSRLSEIHLQVMGVVQLEIIQQRLLDCYGLAVAFNEGSIVYAETLTQSVEGVGHFEPLRHYAEVHIVLTPAPRSSGLHYRSVCSQDVLGARYQQLILDHCRQKEHVGVLIGAPLTDITMTLVTGRAHVKHTEGGDFREATYRAIRQGLMVARREGACLLLEPWYRFRLEVPVAMLGRAMADVQRMSGVASAPEVLAEYATLCGEAPVSQMRDYAMQVNEYSRGRGHLNCVFAGYKPCHNAEEVIDQAQYDPERDVDNTPDSVFCAHGAGYQVKWYCVEDFMHCPYAG